MSAFLAVVDKGVRLWCLDVEGELRAGFADLTDLQLGCG